MQHTRCGKDYHWSWVLNVCTIEGLRRAETINIYATYQTIKNGTAQERHIKTHSHLNMFEFEHVPLHKGASNFLIGPGYEQFIVMICLQKYKSTVNK